MGMTRSEMPRISLELNRGFLPGDIMTKCLKNMTISSGYNRSDFNAFAGEAIKEFGSD